MRRKAKSCDVTLSGQTLAYYKQIGNSRRRLFSAVPRLAPMARIRITDSKHSSLDGMCVHLLIHPLTR